MKTNKRVADIITKWYKALPFSKEYDDAFYQALDEVYVDEAWTIDSYDKKCENGLQNLLAYLYFVDEMKLHYEKIGADESIFLDSANDIVRWCDAWSETKGELNDFLSTLPSELITPTPELYAEIIKEMLCAEASDDEFLFHSGFFRLLSMLKKDSERYKLLYENADTTRRDAVSLGLDFIERNFTKKCTLSDISKHVHLSQIYFHTVFKSAIGKTPYEYVNSLRIEEAKRRLLTSYSEKTGFSDIAFDCGFSSQSYFNHAFKKSTGMTPGEYRKKNLEKYLSYGGLAPKKES